MREEFDWNLVNYAPIMVFGLILIVGIWWLVSARRTFTGPRRTIELSDEPQEPGTPAAAPASP